MNVVINFNKIETKDDFKKYKLKLDDISLLQRIIEQVKNSSENEYFFCVSESLKDEISEYIQKLEIVKKINVCTFESCTEAQKLKTISTDEIVECFNQLVIIDWESILGDAFDNSHGLIYVDGSKLYKKNVFDFSEADDNLYINFTDKNNINSNLLLFIKSNKFSANEIKKIEINDFKYNFINMCKFDSIINSSSKFSNNKQLQYEYILMLLGEFQFLAALREMKKNANIDGFWAMFYLDYLRGLGYESEFIKFYKNNDRFLKNYQFTATQKNQYNDLFEIFTLIDTGQPIINASIKDYIKHGNYEFDFIIKSIKESKVKDANLSYLIRKLIKKDLLTSEMCISIFEVLEKIQINPYIKMKNVVDIGDYFILKNNSKVLSLEGLKKLYFLLNQNRNLFSNTISKKINIYNTNLDISLDSNIQLPTFEIYPNSSNKVAVCISGMPKYNYEKNLELINNFLSPNLDVEYFVQTWDVFESFPGLGTYKVTSDFEWANYYMAKLNNLQPNYLKRQANFEAIMPNVAEVLLNKQYKDLDTNSIKEIFGDKLKLVNKLSFDSLSKKLNFKNKTETYNSLLVTSIGKSSVSSLVQEYIEKTNVEYGYVINIDINTVLTSPIYMEELKNIIEGEVYIANIDNNPVGKEITISKLNTSLYINNLWKIYQQAKSIRPYKYNNQLSADMNQDSMFLHLIANKIEMKTFEYRFGRPYTNKKIKIPSIKNELKLDLQNLDHGVDEVEAYFMEIERLFTADFKNNINYTYITNVDLITTKVCDGGVYLELSIKGSNLKNLDKNKFHLHGTSQTSLDSELSRSRLYKQPFEFLKYDNEEVVVSKIVNDKDLVIGKSWNFTLLYHDYTISHYKINTYNDSQEFELTKYGLKFIDTRDSITVGIRTKSYFLN